jgi:hypothetical protein
MVNTVLGNFQNDMQSFNTYLEEFEISFLLTDIFVCVTEVFLDGQCPSGCQ